jgi:hypothetical protein
MFSTGWFLLRGDGRCALAAVAAGVLLCIDAWFDVTTSTPGAALATAVAMAVLAEIPLALLCFALALRVLHSLTQGPHSTDAQSQELR